MLNLKNKNRLRFNLHK